MKVFFAVVCLSVGGAGIAVEPVKEAPAISIPMASTNFIAKDYSHLVGMKGFSRELLQLHFSLYQGYVKNLNVLSGQIESFQKDILNRSYEFGALKRRWAWEYDGMRLHELYFDNLGGSGAMALDPSLQKAIEEHFVSLDAWKADFIATGMMRGIGWVILYKDQASGRLFNVWINEHDTGHFIGNIPLLVMDVFEHAYITEYGLEKERYINAFFANINWKVVSDRWLK